MDTFPNPASLRQRLKFELQGLHSRDLEQQSVGAVRIVLNGVRNGPLLKPALQELLSDLGSSSRQAVKLRLQLAEYCILKCASRVQLPALVPLLLKQANLVLANNGNDAGCVSSLAALMSSMLAKMLHEPATSSYAQIHGGSKASKFLAADGLCETLLYPVIRGTYRDPEQCRVSAGSVVLLGMLDVMKAYAGQSLEVQEAIRRSLTLILQLLGQGNFTIRVPGVLLPACVCSEALGASISEDVAKRLLLLCLKSTAVKEVWQVRRDAVGTLEMLATVLQPTVLLPVTSVATSAAQEALIIRGPATDVLVSRKQQILQVLEEARYDKIAAVRAAAATALSAVLALPDPSQPPDPAAGSQPTTLASSAAPSKWKRWDNTPSSSSRRRRGLTGVPRTAATAIAASGQQTRRPRFSRPQYAPGTVLNYGIQVFAPPSPPKRPSPAPAVAPDAAHSLGSAVDQSSVKRQLSFDRHDKEGTPDRLRQSVDASSQTSQAEQLYSVHSPSITSRLSPSSAAGLAASLTSPGGQVFSADAYHLLDQRQQQTGLSAMLAAYSGSPARFDVSHHVHGRVELGIVYSPALGSPVRPDIAAAVTAAASGPSHAEGQPGDILAQSVSGDTAASDAGHTGWPHHQLGEQQQRVHQQHEQSGEPDAVGTEASQQAKYPQGQLQQQHAQLLPDTTRHSVSLEPSFSNDLASTVGVLESAPGTESMKPPNTAADSMLLALNQAQLPAADSSTSAGDIGTNAVQPHETGCPEAEAPALLNHWQLDMTLDSVEQPQPQLQDMLQKSCRSLQLLLQGISLQGTQHQQLVQQPPHSLPDNELQPQPQSAGSVQLPPHSLTTQNGDLVKDGLPGRGRQEEQQLNVDEQQQPAVEQPQELPRQSSGQQDAQQWSNPESDSSDVPADNSQQQVGKHRLEARRLRQRWQLPEPAADVVFTAGLLEAAGDDSQAARPAAGHSVASTRPSSRLSSRQQSRSYSRQGSRGAQDSSSGSSLDVLRSVGERVQGLLEALSRQTSGGGARPTSEAVAASLPAAGSGLTGTVHACATAGALPAAGAASHAEEAPSTQYVLAGSQAAPCGQDTQSSAPSDMSPHRNTDSQSMSRDQAGADQLQQQQPIGLDVEMTPNQSPVAAASDEAQVSPNNLEEQEQAMQIQQQQLRVELLQAPSSTDDGSEVNMQLNELYQSAADSLQLEHSAAAQSRVAAASQIRSSQLVKNDDSAGLEQVEKALQKLQNLRSTLQSIGGSAASSRQPSNGSRVLFTAAAATAGTGGSSRAHSMVCDAADGEADVSRQEPEQPAALGLAGDWLQQLSQRLQGMGADVNSQAEGSEPDGLTVDAAATLVVASVHLPPPLQQASQLDTMHPDPMQATMANLELIAEADSGVIQAEMPVHDPAGLQLQDRTAASPGSSGDWSGASTRSMGSLEVPDNSNPAHQHSGVQGQTPQPMKQAYLGSEQSTTVAGVVNTIYSPHTACPAHNVSEAAATPVDANNTGLLAGSRCEPVQLQRVQTLQQMLDASEDTALLMSLAFKLDALAKNFKRHGAEFHATAAAEDAGDAGAAMSNTSSPADSWTNILHNDLFMALPTNGPAASLQQRPTDQGCTPDSSAAGCELEAFRHPSDLHNWRHGLVPEVAAERPWLELQDAALQQVLGVSLQELQDGGHQVVQQIADVAEQVQHQLQIFSSRQPVTGSQRELHHGVPPADLVTRAHIGGHQLQPLLVMLLHSYQQAIQKHCRQLVLLQSPRPPYGWEAMAQEIAQQQIQWFMDQQLHRVIFLLSSGHGMHSSLSFDERAIFEVR